MWDLFIQFITTMVHVYLLTEKEKEKENPGGGLQNEGVNKRKDRRFWVEISEAANKKLKEIPPENEEKANLNETLLKLPPLGLKFSKTSSFEDILEITLSQENSGQSAAQAKANSDSEKLKASNFLALVLRIGSWEEYPRREGALVAKCYYAKKKLVWEILENSLKKKIEIQWSDIIAIRATIVQDKPGILEIELNNPPSFFEESDPMPRKHTLWKISSDFTNGQALIYRRHYIEFPPGVLDKHYEKLLQCDTHMSKLSQKPFPSLSSPYFHTDCYNGITQFSLDFNGHGSFNPNLQLPFSSMPTPSFTTMPTPSFTTSQRIQAYEQANQQYLIMKNSTSPESVTDFSAHSDEAISHQRVDDPRMAIWNQGMIASADVLGRDQIQERTTPAQNNSASNTQIPSNTRNQLLEESQAEYSGSRNVITRVTSFSSLYTFPKEENPARSTSAPNMDNEENATADNDRVYKATNNFNSVSELYPHYQPQDDNADLMMQLPGNDYSIDMIFDPNPAMEDFTTASNFDGVNFRYNRRM
uniref:TRF2/HOY1 PH-like domain-containing protein n=1 Tax=Fagus sylvatica TaxID=28930 RepID=A0A2N9IDS9_FAGSY